MTGWPAPNLDLWQWLLLGVGAYIAVMALARLMKQRHAELVADLTRQATIAGQRRKAEERKKAQEKKATKPPEKRKAA